MLAAARDNPGAVPYLPPPRIESGLDTVARFDARRALRGEMLRQEVYGLDASSLETEPYLIREHQPEVRRVAVGPGDRGSVFAVIPRQSRTFQIERDTAEPRVLREVALEVSTSDAQYGHVTRQASVALGRLRGPAQQQRTWVEIERDDVEHHDTFGGVYRVRQPVRRERREASNVSVAADTPVEDLISAIDAAPHRIRSDVETLYWNDDSNGGAAAGQVGAAYAGGA